MLYSWENSTISEYSTAEDPYVSDSTEWSSIYSEVTQSDPASNYAGNLFSDNVLFCYRANDADSLDVANYYRTSRKLQENHLLALPVADSTVISEYDLIDLESRILYRMDELGHDFSVNGKKTIFVIILGYHVPYKYENDRGDILSIPSRLHRLGKPKHADFANPSFNRTASFRNFNEEDASDVLITAVLNGPSVGFVKRLIDNGIGVTNNYSARGKIFLNPYGKETDAYESVILDFVDNELENLGIEPSMTVPPQGRVVVDGYTDRPAKYPYIEYFEDDSFYWGRSIDYISSGLFATQNRRRIFAYNQDGVSAASITSSLSDDTGPWCNVCLSVGYALSGGSIGEISPDRHLNPRAFFEALHHNCSVGEAFLFASPVLESKLVLFGDPLATVMFYTPLPKHQDAGYTQRLNDDSIRLAKKCIEDGLAFGVRCSEIIDDIVDSLIQTADMDQLLQFMMPFKQWQGRRSVEYFYDLYRTPTAEWIRYILDTTGLRALEWMQNHNLTTTRDFVSLCSKMGAPLPESMIRPDGEWDFEFTYLHTKLTLETVHFELELSESSDFLISWRISSLADASGWYYEHEYNEFDMISEGFMSNLSKRRVRYVSPVSRRLTPNSIYYLRWRAIDVNGLQINEWSDPDKLIVPR